MKKCMTFWVGDDVKKKFTSILKNRSLTAGGFIKLVIDKVIEEEDDMINYIMRG